MNRKDVTNKIIAELEKGVCPWKRSWAFIAHRNHFSGKCYRRMNQILLNCRDAANASFPDTSMPEPAGFETGLRRFFTSQYKRKRKAYFV
jgi:hypothetical protein